MQDHQDRKFGFGVWVEGGAGGLTSLDRQHCGSCVRLVMLSSYVQKHDIGALIIRIGFWGILYYNDNKESPKYNR